MAFLGYRRSADKHIDRAHNAIGLAEMSLLHSFTDAARESALRDLASAQDYLARACAARDAWDSVDHDDFEEYPDVPRHVDLFNR